MAEIINGKLVAAELRAGIKAEVETFKAENGLDVGLAVIIVGSNPASQVYVRNKAKACEEVGITSYVISLPESLYRTERSPLLSFCTLKGSPLINNDENISVIGA